MYKFAVFMVFGLLLTASGNTMLFQHLGTNNPSSEGWSPRHPGTDVVTGPIVDMGTSAWQVDDNGGSARIYEAFPTLQQHQLAYSNGWSLSAELRILDNSNLAEGPMFMDYNFDNRRFGAFFGVDSNGDPMVNVWNGQMGTLGLVYTNQGAGATYHLYEMVYNPLHDSAEFYIDGTKIFSDIQGVNSYANNRVAWGAGHNPHTGHANYAMVSFDVIPEPVSVSMIALASGGFLFVRRRFMG